MAKLSPDGKSLNTTTIPSSERKPKKDSKSSASIKQKEPNQTKNQQTRLTHNVDSALTRNTVGDSLQIIERLENLFLSRGLPVIVRPDGDAPVSQQYLLPTNKKDFSSKELATKLQETAAWKAYVDQERGIATAMYSIVAVEKRLSGNDEDSLRGYAFVQAYMKRLEALSDSFKIMYEGLSRQVAVREQDSKIQGSRRYT